MAEKAKADQAKATRSAESLPPGALEVYCLVHRPDRVALELLHAQAAWISTHDAVTLRRALLRVLTSLDE
jgi:hypothetical protein